MAGLAAHGIHARHIAQEHSYVKDMWQRLTNPDLLIYLHVSYPIAQERRKLSWLPNEYEKQTERLAHARQHADIIIETDLLTPPEVLAEVLNHLKELTDD